MSEEAAPAVLVEIAVDVIAELRDEAIGMYGVPHMPHETPNQTHPQRAADELADALHRVLYARQERGLITLVPNQSGGES